MTKRDSAPTMRFTERDAGHVVCIVCREHDGGQDKRGEHDPIGH